jgi:hypothetical protein
MSRFSVSHPEGNGDFENLLQTYETTPSICDDCPFFITSLLILTFCP